MPSADVLGWVFWSCNGGGTRFVSFDCRTSRTGSAPNEVAEQCMEFGEVEVCISLLQNKRQNRVSEMQIGCVSPLTQQARWILYCYIVWTLWKAPVWIVHTTTGLNSSSADYLKDWRFPIRTKYKTGFLKCKFLLYTVAFLLLLTMCCSLHCVNTVWKRIPVLVPPLKLITAQVMAQSSLSNKLSSHRGELPVEVGRLSKSNKRSPGSGFS